MAMAHGRKSPITARSGAPRFPILIGLPIAMAAGSTNPIGVGPGSRPTLGAGRHITTGAGCISMAAGDGGPVRLTVIPTIARSGRLPMSRSMALAAALAEGLGSVSVAAGDRLAGSRLDHVTTSIRGTDGMVGASAIATSVPSTVAVFLRCMAATASRT